jgi:hypothetical protein
MRVPLIGKRRNKAARAANPVPVINEAAPGPVARMILEQAGLPDALYVNTEARADLAEALNRTDQPATRLAEYVGFNKAGRPYDKRTGKLISASKLAEHEV